MIAGEMGTLYVREQEREKACGISIHMVCISPNPTNNLLRTEQVNTEIQMKILQGTEHDGTGVGI